MKKKFLLLVSLVLLGVQGWSIPLDSLKTHVSTLDSLQRNRFERLDTLKPFDGFIHPGFNPSSIVFDDVNGNTSNKFSFTCLSNLPDTITFTTNVGESESYSFDLTDIAGGGPAPEHQGGSAFLDVLFVVNLNDKTGMYTHEKQMLEDDGPFSSGDYWLWQPTTRHSVIYLPTTSGSHDAKVVVRALLMGVIPIQKKTIYLKGSTINTSTDLERHINTSGPSFPDVIVGDSVTVPLHVSGTNLNGPLSVKLDDKTGMFHIDRDNITADEATNGGVDVMVTYKPTFPGTHGASIDITGDVSENVSVVFTGHSNYPSPPLITVDPTSLDFGDVVKGETRTRPITITGTYLTDSLTLFLDQDYPYVFSIDKTSISIEEAKNGAIVNVTYSPTMLGNNDWGNIEIYIGNAQNPIYWIQGQDPIDVPLSGFADWPPTPTITVNTTSLDFETIEVGQEKPMSINVTGKNLTGSIIVTKEETHDGQFSISRETLPASGGSVIVTFKPTEAGSFGGRVIISNDGAASKTVSLSGFARELSVTKSSLDFGTIKKNETAPKTFTVYGGNLLCDVTLLSSKPDLFEVIPETITPAEAKAGKEVTVIYKPTAGGTHSGKIIVSAEGVTNKEVAVSGKCAEIKVNKTSLNFGTIEVGNDTTITLNVTGTNVTGTISVKKEETHDGQFTISRETLPASGGSVIVTFKPTEAGSFGGSVRISGEGASPVSVSLAGSARQLSVTKTSLDFGTTNKNGTVTRKFTVYGGNLAGNVTLTSSNSKFTVTPTTITPAEAKAGKEVTVTYKPTAGGTHSGKVIVSASGVTPKTVSVSGKCAVISSNPASYNFGNVAVGKPVTKEIIVTGTNLTSAMSITLAETEGGQFTINKNTLPASGGTIIVTFKPTDAKTFGASLNISGGSASAVSIDLSGKGVTPTITRNKTELDYSGSAISYEYVKITGTNLDDVISLEVTGSGRTHFTLSTNTISISDAAEGKQVKVTCNPKNASSADATLEISSPYATTKKVTLKFRKGSSGGGETQICSVEPEDGSESGNNEFMNEGSLEMMSTSTTDVKELSLISKIYAEGLNIIIESPIEQSAIISDISGRARTVNLQLGRNEIPVNASGIYIVRIREKSTKLMLK